MNSYVQCSLHMVRATEKAIGLGVARQPGRPSAFLQCEGIKASANLLQTVCYQADQRRRYCMMECMGVLPLVSDPQ